MALPVDGELTTTSVPAPFLPPRDRPKHPLVEYEMGGVALNDGSAGLEVKIWRCRAAGGTFTIDAPDVPAVQFLSVAGVVEQMSFAFDQNMQPAIVYQLTTGECALYWFDPTIPGFTTLHLPEGSYSPRCSLDDHRDVATIGGWSDVILAYIRGDDLIIRLQRDRYDTEYVVASEMSDADIDQVGMNSLLRFQLRILGGPTNTPAAISIERILRDICGRVGVAADARDHVLNEVDGYSLTRETTARSAIAPLRTVGLFDIVARGGTLRFPARGRAPVASIGVDQLGAHLSGEQAPPGLAVTKQQDVELPRQIRLRYRSVSRDYEIGEQVSPVRHGTASVNDVATDVPIALSDDKATQIPGIMFREAWASRWHYQVALGVNWTQLEPGDVLLLPDEGRLYRARITHIQDTALILRRINAVRDDDGAYVSAAVGSIELKPGTTVIMLGETALVFLDLPALRLDLDDDAGFYIAAYRTGVGATWPGARVWKSVDHETYTVVEAIATQATIGTIVSAPVDGDPYTWDDTRELMVDVANGTLESRTDQAVLAGANAAAVGDAGRWQIVQWANAELVSPGRYRLTRLLWGRRGTEHLIGTSMPDDAFIALSGLARHVQPVSEIGATRRYRGVTNGALFDTGADQDFAGDGGSLLPFSPVYAQGERDGSGNLTITWMRRDRLSETLRDGVAVPMSEDSEAYEVDVLDGMSVVRTIAGLSSPEAAYSAADQTTDFGSPQPSITVRIYQLSAQVGRGTQLEVTV